MAVNAFGAFGSDRMQREVLRFIRTPGAELTSMILWDLINTHAPRAEEQRLLWLRFRLDPRAVPILHRQIANPRKVNQRLNNDFYGRIIRTKAGYMASDISIIVEEEAEAEAAQIPEEQRAAAAQLIGRWNRTVNWEAKRTELAQHDTGLGTTYLLLFVPAEEAEVEDRETIPRCLVSPPWETILIKDGATGETEFALRYFERDIIDFTTITPSTKAGTLLTPGAERKPVSDHPSPQRETRRRARMIVEWYDRRTVTFFIEQDDGDQNTRGTLAINAEEFPRTSEFAAGVRPHFFDGVPVVEFPNNTLRQGDGEIPINLIDAYDIAESDLSSEITQMRLAYLLVKGSGKTIDTQFLKELEQTGIFAVDENGDVSFLEKNLNEEAVLSLLALLKRNIFLFGNSVDFTDEQFKANLPIVAFMLALKPLEESAQMTEDLWKGALRELWRLLLTWFKDFGGRDIEQIDETLLDFQFTRNVPANITEEIDQFVKLVGNTSLATALSRLSFVSDVDEELQRIESEVGTPALARRGEADGEAARSAIFAAIEADGENGANGTQ